ncbi:hypothetical protein IGI04_011338 [Brassica rapa subsp. trilocularis]|uniref:Uncharacterized protein n=1 Tax=Brassica rapa subsp. trilocularis TaxID=1813537 RepID=A0ABQ7N2T6_BRACM|nr:hypothetical protein IGI04_011338 [Brassica rapa subsp. trilocularis]
MHDRWILDIYIIIQWCGWIWMDSLEKVQLIGTRNYPRREFALHSEVETLRWRWRVYVPTFMSKIIHISRAQNRISDTFFRPVKSFYKNLCFTGYSIIFYYRDHLKSEK